MSREHQDCNSFHSQVPQTWDHFLTCSLGGDHGGSFLSPQDNFPAQSFKCVWGDYPFIPGSLNQEIVNSRVTSQLSPAIQVLTEIALSMTTQPQRCCPRAAPYCPSGSPLSLLPQTEANYNSYCTSKPPGSPPSPVPGVGTVAVPSTPSCPKSGVTSTPVPQNL